ncbi:MAG: ankyrin repeat domain-containing protein [Pyrinomonadaceae bacterium]
MIKRFFKYLIITFFIVLVLYLVVPLPQTILELSKKDFPREEPITLIPNEQNKNEKCKAKTIYFSTKDKQVYENEDYKFVVDDYCADLQEKLLKAIDSEDTKNIRTLIAQGANPNTPDISSFEANYPLISASYHDNAAMIKLLLDNGADINQEWCCCMSCSTALANATSRNHVESVKLLLERGANTNYHLKYEYIWMKSFDIAAVKGNSEIMNLYDVNCGFNVPCRGEVRIKRLFYNLIRPFFKQK